MSLVTLSPQETVDLAEALTTRSISANVISRWLGERGYSVSQKVVRRHRVGECACR